MEPSLRQQAYSHILEWIKSGHLPQGSVTSEIQLSSKLNMSRTPIRAALQQLELEGFIRIAPKHGVLVLDSSSQRVGDLLEVIASMILFSVSVSWSSRHDELLSLLDVHSRHFHTLMTAGQQDPHAFIAFELELFDQLIALCNNSEMTQHFHSATSRLFWTHNYNRWQAPYVGTTSNQVDALLQSTHINLATFQRVLFDYLHTLKLTWN